VADSLNNIAYVNITIEGYVCPTVFIVTVYNTFYFTWYFSNTVILDIVCHILNFSYWSV